MLEQDLKDFHATILAHGFAGHARYLQRIALNRIGAWRAAAEQGAAAAQFLVALCHANNIGTSFDLAESLRLYHLAADQGFAPAQTQLALHYEEGQGVKQSTEEALRWYLRSAETGFFLAQYRLGWMYE